MWPGDAGQAFVDSAADDQRVFVDDARRRQADVLRVGIAIEVAAKIDAAAVAKSGIGLPVLASSAYTCWSPEVKIRRSSPLAQYMTPRLGARHVKPESNVQRCSPVSAFNANVLFVGVHARGRRRRRSAASADRRFPAVIRPRHFEALDVGAIDLLQRRVADLFRSTAVAGPISSGVRRGLGAQRLRLGARRSALGAQRLRLGTRRSALGAQRLRLGTRRSALGAQRLRLGGRRSALRDLVLAACTIASARPTARRRGYFAPPLTLGLSSAWRSPSTY